MTLPEGVGLDLGGIGKGWAVDLSARLLSPFRSHAIDAGGDMYLAGVQADGSPWTVGVQDPSHSEEDLLVIAVSDRAVATSSVSRRRWINHGKEQHHLIDPRTGRPAKNGVLAVTVVADSVARAEVLAKAGLLLGPVLGPDFLARESGIEWIMVHAGGQVEKSGDLVEVQYAC